MADDDEKIVPVAQDKFEGADKKVAVTGVEISDETWAAATSAWIDNHVRNTAIAGNTEAWNHLTGALPHLRKYLESGGA